MTSQTLSQADIDFVNNLVVEAGNMAVVLQASGLEKQSGEFTAISTIDEKISQILVSALEKRFPDQMIISEEALPEKHALGKDNVWLVDPIDGTHHYLANESQYSVMVGLLANRQPVYGWVYNPAYSLLYYGGLGHGVWRYDQNKKRHLVALLGTIESNNVRVVLGKRDLKNNPWIEALANVTIIQAGSIGYKLSKILEGEADILLHLAGRLKIWDTAGPVALALAAGLDVGSECIDQLLYPNDSFMHPLAIVIGKRGSLEWFRSKVIPLWIQ